MAKGTLSKKRKAPSIHSRAARRATSPGIDTDKSLKNVQRPAESVDSRPSVLAIHQGAGVTKKTRKGRNASSKAKKRMEKAQDRAAAIAERTQTKVAKSKGQSRKIQSRSKNWDDINKKAPGSATEAGDKETDEDEEEEVSEFDDDEMDETIVPEEPAQAAPGTDKIDDDEIL